MVENLVPQLKTKVSALGTKLTTLHHDPRFVDNNPAQALDLARGPEDYPNGFCIPFSRFLELTRAGMDTLGSYNVRQVEPYMKLLYPFLEQAGLQIFESAVSDIGQIAFDGFSPSNKTNTMLPFTHDLEIYEILEKARRLKLDPSTFHPIVQALWKIQNIINPQARKLNKAVDIAKFNTASSERIELNARITRALVQGPDIDGRLNIPPERLFVWMDSMSNQIIAHFSSQGRKMAAYDMEYNGKITRRILLKDEIIRAWDRADIINHHDPILDQTVYPGFQFEYGVYADTGIPYVNIQFIGQAYAADPYTSSVFMPLVDIGLSSHPDFMPDEMKKKDSRTGVGTVNNRNTIFIPTSTTPRKFSDQLPFDSVPTETELAATTGNRRYNDVKQITNQGVVLPTIAGEWNNEGQYVIPQGSELWMYLSPVVLSKLKEPVRFGEKFGSKPLEETFIEALRTVRYTLREGSFINFNDPINQRAKRIIRGEQSIHYGAILPYAIRKLIENEGYSSQLNMNAIREIASCLFYAPKEFIAYGRTIGLSAYLPHWNVFEAIYDDLPDREHVIRDLTGNPNLLVYGLQGKKTAYQHFTEAVRHTHLIDRQIKFMNDLEIIYWLASMI